MTVLERRKIKPDKPTEPAWDIASLFPAQGHWAVEDYLNLDTNHLVEFSHGIVEVLPMPSDKHQAIVIHLIMLLSALAQRLGGSARIAPLRMQFGKARSGSRTCSSWPRPRTPAARTPCGWVRIW